MAGSRHFAVGEPVEREIDGMWFPAEVLAIHVNKGEDAGDVLDVLYLDDGKRELDVPIQEVRRRRPDEEGKDQDAKRIPATPFILVPSAEERLLMDEESESRVADVHTQVTYGKEEGTAYIINGPENNVAAGSGLRALRWLRN